MSIGERIADLRKAQGLSQGQLAALMGVSRQAISKWENNQASPDTQNLISLAELFESDITYLATGERSEKASAPEPVVMTVVKEVIKKVEVEKLVEVERFVEVEKPIIRRRVRIKYRNNPLHLLILGGGCFLLGLALGLLL